MPKIMPDFERSVRLLILTLFALQFCTVSENVLIIWILICLNTITYTAKPSTKPSPSKRLCSSNTETQASSIENVQPVPSSSTSHRSPEVTSESHIAASNRASLAQPLEKGKTTIKSETPAALSVKTRMQKLAEQRRCWDSEGMFHLLNSIGVFQCLYRWQCVVVDNFLCERMLMFSYRILVDSTGKGLK